MGALDWNGFINGFPGDALRLGDYPGSITKIVAVPNATASMQAGNARFERWCASHDGKSGPISQLAGVNSAVGSLNAGLGAKINAERASGLAWTATSALACVREVKPQVLIAAMVTETGRPSEARQIDGKAFDKLTRAFLRVSRHSCNRQQKRA